jgi:hypothetical protein
MRPKTHLGYTATNSRLADIARRAAISHSQPQHPNGFDF